MLHLAFAAEGCVLFVMLFVWVISYFILKLYSFIWHCRIWQLLTYLVS